MVLESQIAPEVCGAKLRDGGHCTTSLAAGSARCFKHGGAPRSGAPKGNRNAFRHGSWADHDSGRAKSTDVIAIEKQMSREAQTELAEPSLVQFVSKAEVSRGRAIAHELKLLAAELDRALRHPGRTDRKSVVALMARREALRFLLARASSFESRSAYQRDVSITFLARPTARAKDRTDVSVEREVYSRVWASYCRELWLRGWPKEALQPQPERLKSRDRAKLRRKFIRTAKNCEDLLDDAEFEHLMERYEDTLWTLGAARQKP